MFHYSAKMQFAVHAVFIIKKIKKRLLLLLISPFIIEVSTMEVHFFMSHYQAMTEAAIFTIGQSRIIGYGKIRPLADYRSQSRLSILDFHLIDLHNFQKLYPQGAGSLEIRN